MSKYKGSNKIISFMSIAFATLVKFQSERLGKLKARIEKSVNLGLPAPRGKLRRSRCWRGRNMGHGRGPEHPKANQRRVAKYYANAARCFPPLVLAHYAKLARQRKDHIWQDPRLQGVGVALAMAA